MASDSLKERMLKTSSINYTDLLIDSKVFQEKEFITTPIPMLNVALSGTVDGGLSAGVTTIAGPSKHFKSLFALTLVYSFQKKFPDGIVLFYDSEFGAPLAYFKSLGINMNNVIHTPITDIEELKTDIMKQIEQLKRSDEVMIIIDSLGNLASRKEKEDALEGKFVADMTRAKAIKSLFRMVTPHLTLKKIPLIVINHTYKEMSLFPKDIVGGGTGSYYSSDNIWIIGRQQDKDKDKSINGYHYIINVEKSRFVREKSKIPISVSYENGILKWSGMLDLAVEAGLLEKTKKGKSLAYALIDPTTKELLEPVMTEDELLNDGSFWRELLSTTDFASFIKNKYSLGEVNMIEED